MNALLKVVGLSFIFRINSAIWFLILKLKCIKVGRNFYIEGVIFLKLKGDANSKISIGNNVSINGDLDLRIRESGKIIIRNNINFDSDIRIVAARNSLINIDNGVRIGRNTMIVAGEDVKIGENVLIGPNSLIQTSNHGFSNPGDIKGQKYSHKRIEIGNGSWIATCVILLPGAFIGEGSVIGAGSVVSKKIDPKSIVSTPPAKIISKRS